MDPYSSLIGAGLNMFGGLAGYIGSSGDYNNSLNAYKNAVAQIQAVQKPQDLVAPVLQQYKSVGQLSPQMQTALQLGPSQVANIQEDPSTRNAQMMALQMLGQRANTGLTASDRANFQQMQNQARSDAQAKIGQILQNQQARGLSGAGSTLAAQLQAAQGGTNNESAMANQVASAANQNALSAMAQYGGLAGNIRSTDFANALAKGTAADQFNRFNVQNQQNVQQQNVNNLNAAQQYNLNNNQGLANQNVAQNNQNMYYANQLAQQNYLNQAGWAGMQANALQNLGNIYGQQANNEAKMFQGMFSGAGQMAQGASMGGMFGGGGM